MTRKEEAVALLRNRVEKLCDPSSWLSEVPEFYSPLMEAVRESDDAEREEERNRT